MIMDNLFNIDKVSIRLVKDSSLNTKEILDSPQKIADVIGDELRDMDREVFCVINLKSDHTPINFTFASVGTLNNTVVCAREVFKAAILSNAASIVVMHNHPSGDLTPSSADIMTTTKLYSLCELMGIPLDDHIIVANGNRDYYSFRQETNVIDKSNFDRNVLNNMLAAEAVAENRKQTR